jgi:DNA-binding transcriptional regulator YiaG
MPNVARVLKEEITRLARREVRVTLEKTRGSVARHQREIAGLKGQVSELKRQVATLEKALNRAEASSRAGAAARPVRFVPKGVASMRKRLGLSAAALAALMGVTGQTIYNWERGATRPSPEQQAKLASLRTAGKRRVQAHLAQQQQG